VGQDPALEEPLQLAPDVSREFPSCRVGVDLLEPGRHVLAYRLVQFALLGSAAAVAVGLWCGQTAGEGGHSKGVGKRRADVWVSLLEWGAVDAPQAVGLVADEPRTVRWCPGARTTPGRSVGHLVRARLRLGSVRSEGSCGPGVGGGRRP